MKISRGNNHQILLSENRMIDLCRNDLRFRRGKILPYVVYRDGDWIQYGLEDYPYSHVGTGKQTYIIVGGG